MSKFTHREAEFRAPWLWVMVIGNWGLMFCLCSTVGVPDVAPVVECEPLTLRVCLSLVQG